MQANQQVTFRTEQEKDYHHNQIMTRQAFWNLYQPGADQHYLTHILRRSPDFIPELSLVAEKGGRVIGHIVYSRSSVQLEEGGELPTITFGPVCVDPSIQANGIGTKLIRFSIDRAKQLGYKAVIISGHPQYYQNRFGFKCCGEYGLTAEDGVSYRGTMALQLEQGYLSGKRGIIHYSKAFQSILPKDVEEFDKLFSPMEKFRTRSQEIFEKAIALKWKDEPDFDPKLIFSKERL